MRLVPALLADMHCRLVMENVPNRSGVTELTDDELLIFDFLFRFSVPERALTRDKYRAHMNAGYSHGLDDSSLRHTLNQLANRGLISSAKEEEDTVYSLGPAGSCLWELERQPIWERFCLSCSGGLRSQAWERDHAIEIWRVLSPSSSTCEEYLTVGAETGHIVLKGREPTIRRRQLTNCPLLSWKTFSEVHSISYKAEADEYWRSDEKVEQFQKSCAALRRFESRSTWWQTAPDIERLHQRQR